MSTWFTSDTHFGHENIIHYCGRPFHSAADMNRQIKLLWNSVVAGGDTMYHVGDFTMSPPDLRCGYRSALKGRIHPLLGNHDGNRKAMLKDVGMDGVETNVVDEVESIGLWLVTIRSLCRTTRLGISCARRRPWQVSL